MKKMWVSALLAAAMMTAAGAADAPSAWAQSSVDAARAAGLVPSQVDSAFETPITREDFCSLAAAVYRAWDRETSCRLPRPARSASLIPITQMCCCVHRQAW